MCPFNANQTRRREPATSSCLPPPSGTCGAAWKMALEGVQRTQWGLLVVFKALTLILSYLYDPGWPLAGLATTKAPKREDGGRWRGDQNRAKKKKTSKKKPPKRAPLPLIPVFLEGCHAQASCMIKKMRFPAFSWRQQTPICCTFCGNKGFDVARLSTVSTFSISKAAHLT